jgi:hypothetical protein
VAAPGGLAKGAPGTGPHGLVVTELVDGGVVAGRLLAAAGPDLHLLDRDGRAVVLDTRLPTGWELAAAPAGHPVTVPVTAAPPPAAESQGSPQDPLF